MSRLHPDVKAGTYEGLKWEVSESEFCLKLPDRPSCSGALRFFRARLPAMAVYMDKTGRPIAWQWRLNKREYRGLWADTRIRSPSI